MKQNWIIQQNVIQNMACAKLTRECTFIIKVWHPLSWLYTICYQKKFTKISQQRDPDVHTVIALYVSILDRLELHRLWAGWQHYSCANVILEVVFCYTLPSIIERKSITFMACFTFNVCCQNWHVLLINCLDSDSDCMLDDFSPVCYVIYIYIYM